jgi:hypothetical protein
MATPMQEHKNYCFDDLGTENNLKYFGNRGNGNPELFSPDMTFIPSKTFKPTSPNLSASEIEKMHMVTAFV